jgi:DNA modification methylase
MTPTVDVYYGDAWDLADDLEASSVDCIVTSPPYWGLRDYGHPDQFGLERTPQEYVAKLVDLFARLRPALKDEGTVWLNLGDSYAGGGFCGSEKALAGKQGTNRGSGNMIGRALDHGLKPKDLVGIPWRVAFALQEDGWYLRSDIIWSKPNPMPESVTDRPTKAHEYVFLLSKSARYYFDADAVREPLDGPLHAPGNKPAFGDVLRNDFGTERMGVVWGNPAGRNIRTVWTIATHPYPEAHFATFPPKLVEPCIKAGCPEGGTVLDPFLGSGTTAEVARKLGRNCVGFELNEDYRPLIEDRLKQGVLL